MGGDKAVTDEEGREGNERNAAFENIPIVVVEDASAHGSIRERLAGGNNTLDE